jgi:L-seryl-tRNA(Ser) seleniumtransferase
MKVNKEEILGMLATVEAYLAIDHEKEWILWENMIQTIHDAAASVPGVIAEIHVPKVANHVPSLRISMEEGKVKMTPDELRQKLREGHPSIETVGGKDSVGITPWMMQPGQERIVASRIKEILEAG